MRRLAGLLLFALAAAALGQDTSISDTPIKLPVLTNSGSVTSIDFDCNSILFDCSGGPITTSGTAVWADKTLTANRIICTGSGTPTLCSFAAGEGLAFSSTTIILDILGLTADTAPASTYTVPFYSVGSTVNKKVTMDNLLKVATVALASKATPVLADEIVIRDSAASSVPKAATLSSFPVVTSSFSTYVSVTGVTTETDLIGTQTSGLTLPNNTLGTHSCYRMSFNGYYLNSVTEVGLTLVKIYYGGTTMYSQATGSITGSAGKRAFSYTGTICGDNSTSAQRVTGLISLGGSTAASTGYGTFTGSAIQAVNFGGVATVNSTTGTNALRFTITPTATVTVIGTGTLEYIP